MDLAGITATLDAAGVKIPFIKLLPLAPLLTKRAVDLADTDVENIFRTFGLPFTDAKLVAETATALRTSNFETVADIVADDNYFVPLMTKVLSVPKEPVLDTTPVRVKCTICTSPIEFHKSELQDYKPDESIVKTCRSCMFPSRYFVGQLLTFWS